MRHVTNAGLALIKRFESFSPAIYVCPPGFPTIGYGHVVKEGDRERFAGGISEDEAEDLLCRDAAIAERAVLRLIAAPLTDSQFDALVSFTFNVGSGALQRSTLRRKVNREEHALVPAEFLKWVWAGGRKLKGLMRRRKAEAVLYTDSAIEQMLDDFHLMHDQARACRTALATTTLSVACGRHPNDGE